VRGGDLHKGGVVNGQNADVGGNDEYNSPIIHVSLCGFFLPLCFLRASVRSRPFVFFFVILIEEFDFSPKNQFFSELRVDEDFLSRIEY
jgi:hypothetical protein